MSTEIFRPLDKTRGRQNLGQGSLFFAKYAFAPNKLKYCGPDDNRAIFDYCVAQQSDQGLVEILAKFEGAYPYLKLIAKANKINDPFDEKVVEAYWIGNNLLSKISVAEFYNSLKDRFGKKIDSKAMKWLVSKPPVGAKPHHSFHVLDVFTKTGLIRSGIKTNVLETINHCLILWGTVIQNPNYKLQITNKSQTPNSNFQNQLTNQPINKLTIKYQPIIIKDGKLMFGEIQTKEIQSLMIQPKIGDIVSFHWNHVCDVLDERQLKNLQAWTKYHLDIANTTI